MSIYSKSTSCHYSNHNEVFSRQKLHRKMIRTKGMWTPPLIHRPAPSSHASGPSHRKLCMCNNSFGEHLWSTQTQQNQLKIIAEFICYLSPGLTWMDGTYYYFYRNMIKLIRKIQFEKLLECTDAWKSKMIFVTQKR